MNTVLPDNQSIDQQAVRIFTGMAARIETNYGADFGGAFVICPPEGGSLATLLLDSKQDPIQFWSLLKAKCEIALAELDQKKRSSQVRGFG